MNIDLIRRLDKFIGIPLCSILSFINRFIPPSQQKNENSNRILIVKLTEMGSTVLAYPAISKLKNMFPAAELHFLTLTENVDIIKALNLDILPHCLHALPSSSAKYFIAKLFKTVRLLRKLNFDAVIDFDFFSRLSAVISFLTGKKKRIGFHRYTNEGLYRGNFLTHKVLYSPHIHTSEAFIALIEASTIDMENAEEPLIRKEISSIKNFVLPRYLPNSEKTNIIKKKLSMRGITISHDSRVVIINPNSSNLFPLRKWPLKYFAETAKQLLAIADNIKIVITGSLSEKKDAQTLLTSINSPASAELAGETDFEELLALYSLSSLIITNDSGPAHFASIVNLPIVVLFGPETPHLYSPFGSAVRCLYAHFACSPCVSVYNAKKSPCKRSLCLEAITVEEVVKNAKELLLL